MVASLTGELGAGLRLGQGLGQMASQRQQQRLGAQQQELLGGLRRQGLGLGAGQRTDVRRQAAELGPDALKQLDAAFSQFDAPQLERKKQDSRLMSTGAATILGKPPEQRPAALIALANNFESTGNPKLAAGTRNLAQMNPEELNNSLLFNQNLGLKIDEIIRSREKVLGIGAESDFSKGKEFVTKDKYGNLKLNTSSFNKRTGKSVVNRTPIDEELVNQLGEKGEEQTLRLIEEAGGKSSAVAKATLSVKAADQAANQVITIDKGIALLDEGIAELEAGADVGIIDKFLPSIKEASSRFDNVANRMGLQVVSSVTFGALSAGELKVAMATAIPPNLDNKQLAKWFKDRKSSQQKLRGFYIEIARKASEEGKTPAEIMIEIEDKNKLKKIKSIQASGGENNEALKWANENPDDPKAAAIKERLGI